jgi:hypothetical protein
MDGLNVEYGTRHIVLLVLKTVSILRVFTSEARHNAHRKSR